MKLSKLIEDEDAEDVIHSDMPSEEDIKKLIDETLKKWMNKYMFDKKFSIPEGVIRLNCIINSPETELGLTYIPNMEPKPVIPVDLLTKSVDMFISDISIMNPDIVKYPIHILNEYSLKFYSVNIYPSEGIISLYDFIPRPSYNTKVSAPRGLGNLLTSHSYLLRNYTFEDNVLPTFSDDYSKQMDKAIRRCKTVYNALQKGNWRGYKYELSPFDVRNIVVHQNRNRHAIDDVLHPNFSVSYSGYYPLLDGKLINTLETEIKDAFMSYIKTRFNIYRIKFS
jgi:hypothetical protein